MTNQKITRTHTTVGAPNQDPEITAAIVAGIADAALNGNADADAYMHKLAAKLGIATTTK